MRNRSPKEQEILDAIEHFKAFDVLIQAARDYIGAVAVINKLRDQVTELQKKNSDLISRIGYMEDSIREHEENSRRTNG